MSQRDLLIEIGTEELPPKALQGLSEAFRDEVVRQLQGLELSFDEVDIFATPRRLAVRISQLSEYGPDKAVDIWGPPAAVAFDQSGAPTRAAQAFAEKNAIDVAELPSLVANDGKQDKLCYRSVSKGASTKVELEGVIAQALASLPIPKRMRWGASRVEFVRPAHWLLVLFGEDVVECKVLGLSSGATTRGHRFMSHGEIEIRAPRDYETALEQQGRVIADFQRRREMIRGQVEQAGQQLGGRAVIDPDLLNEVTALVEWPVALAGSFEKRFLKVPAEALISSMKEHQKYFHVEDNNGFLMPHFITVANIESSDPRKIVDGNERVIRPRLSDAAFFFETDCNTSLEQQRERLRHIVFQEKLGTVFDKTERVAQLAHSIAAQLGVDVDHARRAALLSKSDLVSEMVGEFDDMQGIAGYYYALNDGEDEAVAAAMNEQYMPRFASDDLPATEVGTVLALADRLDTITGIFGIGQIPTGSKDPFALRRASLGVLRILIEKSLALDLRPLIEQAILQHPGIKQDEDLVEQVLQYVLERLRAWYEDRGIRGEIYEAVTAKSLTVPVDIDARVRAVQSFYQLAEAQSLAAANKRVSNILAKAGEVSPVLDEALLSEEPEQALAAALRHHKKTVAPLFAAGRYEEGLKTLASLQPTIDRFFDEVMVNTEDEALRRNRLALLRQLRDLFLETADISKLVVAKG